MSGFFHLFKPINIGGMALKNRIVMSPMTTNYGNSEQEPTPQLIEYYAARAGGGVGLITLEVCTVDVQHRYQPQSLTLGADRFIDLHRPMVDAIHRHGAKCQPQITHPGPESLSPLFGGGAPLGASLGLSPTTGQQCRAIEAVEIDKIVEDYGDAAWRAQQANYDGMELHAAHCYMLMGAFLSPTRNLRFDDYSAFTLAGRTKFLLRVIRRMKERTEGRLPLTLSISGFERTAGGRDINDTQNMARLLVQAGVDAFRVSGGAMDKLCTDVVPSAKGGAINAGIAQALKQVVNVPIIVVGGIHDPLLAEQIIADGKTDLVAMGRPFLADPEWPNKAQAGQLQHIRRCIACQNCIDSIVLTGRMACAINAQTGREMELKIEPIKQPKRVWIIGAGAGGMEVARTAAMRGHRVTLIDRSKVIGGTLKLAAQTDSSHQSFLAFLTEQMLALAIDIKLGVNVSAEQIIAAQPDAVVLATGALLSLPVIEGIDLPHVVSGADLLVAIDRLSKGDDVEHLVRGRRVAIIGADLIAMKLAEIMARHGYEVMLLHASDELGAELGPKRRLEHMLRLDECGVVVNTGVMIESITLAGINIHTGYESRAISVDSILVLGERQPSSELFEKLKNRLPEVHRVGDCKAVGLIADAIADGARVAHAL